MDKMFAVEMFHEVAGKTVAMVPSTISATKLQEVLTNSAVPALTVTEAIQAGYFEYESRMSASPYKIVYTAID